MECQQCTPTRNVTTCSSTIYHHFSSLPLKINGFRYVISAQGLVVGGGGSVGQQCRWRHRLFLRKMPAMLFKAEEPVAPASRAAHVQRHGSATAAWGKVKVVAAHAPGL